MWQIVFSTIYSFAFSSFRKFNITKARALASIFLFILLLHVDFYFFFFIYLHWWIRTWIHDMRIFVKIFKHDKCKKFKWFFSLLAFSFHFLYFLFTGKWKKKNKNVGIGRNTVRIALGSHFYQFSIRFSSRTKCKFSYNCFHCDWVYLWILVTMKMKRWNMSHDSFSIICIKGMRKFN